MKFGDFSTDSDSDGDELGVGYLTSEMKPLRSSRRGTQEPSSRGVGASSGHSSEQSSRTVAEILATLKLSAVDSSSGTADAHSKSSFAHANLLNLPERAYLRTMEFLPFPFLRASYAPLCKMALSKYTAYAPLRRKLCLSGPSFPKFQLPSGIDCQPSPSTSSGTPSSFFSAFDSLVSVHFRDVASTSIDCSISDLVELVAKSCPLLVEFSFSADEESLEDRDLIPLGSLECLRSLSLYANSAISDKGLRRVAESCSKLTTLNVSRCSLVTDAGVIAVSENCPGLRSLELGFCQKITNASLSALGKNCPKLEMLDLWLCFLISDPGLEVVAEGCPLLQELTLLECTRVTSYTLVALGNHCKGLRKLIAYNCNLIGDEGVMALAGNCHELRRIDLTLCGKISEHALVQLVRRSKHLEELQLVECVIATTPQVGIGEVCSGLLELDLAMCSAVDDSGLKTIILGCPYLESLGLESCELLTEKSLILLSCLKRLRDLNCWGVTGMTDAVLEAIAAQGTLEDATPPPLLLETMNLGQCSQITDKGLGSLLLRCKHLDTLILKYCNKVGDIALLSAALGCPELKTLDLADCVNITTEGIIGISKNCRDLEWISICNCTKVMDEGFNSTTPTDDLDGNNISLLWALAINALVFACGNLTFINLGYYSSVSDPCIKSLEAFKKNTIHIDKSGF